MKGYTIQNSITLLEKEVKNGGSGGSTTAAGVSYDNTTSGLTATDVQAAIDEIVNEMPTTATEVCYDNTTSGLTATDVQAAIDEIVDEMPTTAAEVSYDNTTSGLTATDVQAAIDELKTPILPDTETLVYNDGTNDVYRKVVDCGALPNNTTKTVDPLITNLGSVRAILPIINYPSDDTYCEFAGSIGRFQARSTGISIVTTADWSAYTCKMVLYYTKTTTRTKKKK